MQEWAVVDAAQIPFLGRKVLIPSTTECAAGCELSAVSSPWDLPSHEESHIAHRHSSSRGQDATQDWLICGMKGWSPFPNSGYV